MRNGLKRATALAMTILMLLALLPAALAEGTELHSDGVVPGLSDGGDLAALLDEVNAADGVASANALLAAYGGISALADGVPIDSGYYSISVDGAPAGDDRYTIDGAFISGEVGEGTVPTVRPTAGGEPLEFVGAYINNAAVTYVGTLEHEGTTYVFYTTAENESSMAATVLGGNDKIELRYTTQAELSITYTLDAADSGWSKDQIFGADRPVAVFAGDNYNVTVRIPRGYTAKVTVNGVDTFTVGEDPKYTTEPFEGNKNEFVVVPVTGSVDSLSLERLIEVTNAQGRQSIAVTLTKDTHIFSAEAVVETRYFSSNGNPRGDFGTTRMTFESVPEGEFRQLWEFTTNLQDGVMWRLDSLQINGEQLAIPFADSPRDVLPVTKTTTLSSGTVVKLRLTSMQGSNGKYTRTYTLSVSNCYEDITISGGNLNASGWTEVIPETLVGVELKIGSGNDSERWKQIDQSEPFSIGTTPDRDYQYGQRDIHFRLKDGYADPVVRYTDAAGNNIPGRFGEDSFELSGPDSSGWYHITINNVGAYQDGNTFTFLHIEAELADYMVTYDDGEEAAEPGSMPQDDTNNGNYYNIVNAAQVPVSNVIPLASDANMAFQHWELEGYGEIKPGDVLSLENFAQYAVRQPNGKYAFPLVAVWQPAETAEYITYQVQFQKDGEDVEGELYTFQTARLEGGATVVILEHAEEIQNFLNSNPDYKLDSENVYLHNNVKNGDILHINFVKADTKVTITKRITGSMGDRQREFAFEVTSTEPFGEPEENAYTLSDDKQTAFFALGHEGFVTLNVPIGAQLKITETDAEGYDVSAEGATKVDGENASFTLTAAEGSQVTVTNYKEARPDTGIVTDSLPYVLILACVIAVIVVVVIRGRNRHDD